MKMPALTALVLLSAVSLRAVSIPPLSREAEITLPDGFKVSARLAVTPAEHAAGLMFVKFLAPDSGMLFIFGGDGMKNFWMKNTLIELDMVFLSGEMKAGRIFHRVPKSFYGQPEAEVARAGASARFVLELAGGTARAHGVKTGSKFKVVFSGAAKADGVSTSSAAVR